LGGEPALGWVAALTATLVSYARVQCRFAGAPMDYCGPMAKPMRMIVIAFAALWMAAAPSAQPDARGVMTLALAIVIAGGAATFIRRLRRAARALHDSAKTT
jgi:hypothetical protein